ncbi:hypothetical protein D3C80_1935570 [compost metagenome]
MSKYAPLTTFLRRQKQGQVILTFRDIERIVRGILPKAATADAWWRTDRSGPMMPQHKAFTDAGFAAEPQIRSELVTFVRVAAKTTVEPDCVRSV